MEDLMNTALGYVTPAYEFVVGWIIDPANWVQFALLVAAYVLAVVITRKLNPILTRALTPPDENQTILAKVRRFVLLFLPLVLPLLAFALTAIGEQVTRSIFGAGEMIAFGKRVFLFLAVRAFVRDMLTDPLLKLLGKMVLIPFAAIYALGFLDPIMMWLEQTIVPLGGMSFSLLGMLRFLVVAIVMFWLGRWSNDQSSAMIQKQEMPAATRQLAVKAAEIAIFGVAFLVAMNIAGVPLSSLAVLTGALGVGIGFGLQKIASNFVSGVILLLEGQATVGDYVELDGGEAGTIVKMTARAAILETYDGKWIVVPNEDFIVTRVVNYSDSGSANRYDVSFSVSYDTDINRIPDIVGPAVAALDFVLSKPEDPDVELDGFGDSGIEFVVEFWVNGIDDGKNKYRSHVRFAIWNALKDAGIEIPFPQRVVEIKGGFPAAPA
ncbi:mechanosensitive ion channel [Octadecabacter sp. 1_MG-2023]|uniref:mechanosensitive ion channel family protein n=1 Tax=unclassified Octadecabacter TaxID=196158 RepID=UPI001C0A14C8|nr:MULTISPECIES: mechanosensitive ion channel domain-containing protein [unclassified Octadecabacter]MBU2992173.1 mechanosensitive ion channel [Octadecabacter sp. B2R22]MDO6735071.1 mechanosensitive ion channel [Octadecabacter sp. 1_MG-2023]